MNQKVLISAVFSATFAVMAIAMSLINVFLEQGTKIPSAYIAVVLAAMLISGCLFTYFHNQDRSSRLNEHLENQQGGAQ